MKVHVTKVGGGRYQISRDGTEPAPGTMSRAEATTGLLLTGYRHVSGSADKGEVELWEPLPIGASHPSPGADKATVAKAPGGYVLRISDGDPVLLPEYSDAVDSLGSNGWQKDGGSAERDGLEHWSRLPFEPGRQRVAEVHHIDDANLGELPAAKEYRELCREVSTLGLRMLNLASRLAAPKGQRVSRADAVMPLSDGLSLRVTIEALVLPSDGKGGKS